MRSCLCIPREANATQYPLAFPLPQKYERPPTASALDSGGPCGLFGNEVILFTAASGTPQRPRVKALDPVKRR